jgi:hypothetical protein
MSGKGLDFLGPLQHPTKTEIQSTETKMRTKAVMFLGAALWMASAIQTAAAAERHHPRKVARASVVVSQPAGNVSGGLSPSIAESDAEYWAGRHGGGYSGH